MKTAIKERPILFSGEMVRAILSGAKTQTRRIIEPQPGLHCSPFQRPDGKYAWIIAASGVAVSEPFHSPYGGPGDRLWVITIKDIPGREGMYGAGDDGRIYRIDGPEPRPLRATKESYP